MATMYRNRKVGPGAPTYLAADGGETEDSAKAHLTHTAVAAAIHSIDYAEVPADWFWEPVSVPGTTMPNDAIAELS